MIIRQEKPEDIDDIHALNELAFGQPQEANIKNAAKCFKGTVNFVSQTLTHKLVDFLQKNQT